MKDKKVLFITFDLSGYYSAVYEELKNNYSEVQFYNTANYSYKYKNVFERVYSFLFKLFTKKKYKNFKRYQPIIKEIENQKFDIFFVIRPDLFFDSQLKKMTSISKRNIAYFHDLINNIPRKKDVISFFDSVYSYEKKDVEDYNLKFISNFIYFDPSIFQLSTFERIGFSVMSFDYRVEVLKKVASIFYSNNQSFDFYVKTDKLIQDESKIHYFSKPRMSNEDVIQYILKSKIIVDIHKYGVQDGLTFRVFEALGFQRKLITTNTDIINYDFYNPNNIYVISDIKNFDIPLSFFETPYKPINQDILEKYLVKNWVKQILTLNE